VLDSRGRAAGASLRSGAARARTSGGDDWEAEAFNQGVLCLGGGAERAVTGTRTRGRGKGRRCEHGSAGAEALQGTSGVGKPVFDFPACATKEGAAVSRFSHFGAS
jgi:hypothetical protein